MYKLPKNFDRANALVAVGVLIGTLIVYVRTQAPTLSLWDCGEFIATSHILGIPHPPGTPTYILFGRIFSLIPTFTDICARVNFLSGLCSALAAMFGYLFAVRVMRSWFEGVATTYNRFLIYAGAAAGAFFLAFGRTQWNNAVEAEVYGMSMMLLFAIAWLTAMYYEHRGTLFASRIMLLIVFLAFIGIGVHMGTFLVLPISLLFFILKKDTPARFWVMLAAFFVVELYLIFALSSRPNEVPYFVPVLIIFFFYLAYVLTFERIGRRLLLVGAGFLVALVPALAGAFGINSDILHTIGVVGYVGLIVYGIFLILSTKAQKKKDEDAARNGMIAGLFVLVSGVLTGLSQVHFSTGADGYRMFLLLSVGLAAVLGLVIWRYIRLPILIALAGPALIVLGVRELFWGTLLALVIVMILGVVWKMADWKTAVLVICVASIGYSTHLFAPVRSAMHPYINENSPGDSLEATINYFERKQYGSQSMTERMFNRRSEWINQFGNHVRMGFWGFFSEQYGLIGPSFVILLLFGLVGVWEAGRRRPALGLYLALLIMVTTIGLVLYMNFADGTRQTAADAWLEVRDRDYFFTPGFMMFGLAIGMGITASLKLMSDLTAKFSPGPRRLVLVIAPILFLLPVNTLARNHYYADRSSDFIPYDYAYNILMSAEEDGVIFTYGDNDTFPLWCLQEVYGVRKDLKLICCALANGDWYIKQLRDYMGLELGWTDDDIANLRPYRTQDGLTFRVQDQVVDAVVSHNFKDRPIYYSLLAYPSYRRLFGVNVDSLLELSGMCFKLTDSVSTEGLRIDVDFNLGLMLDSGVFQYRGWTDPDVFVNATTDRSLRGAAEHILMVTEEAMRQNRVEDAVRLTELLADSVYLSAPTIGLLADLYAEAGDTAGLARIMHKYNAIDSTRVVLALSKAHVNKGERDRAAAVLADWLRGHPSDRVILNELMRIYIGDRNVDAMLSELRVWMINNQGDTEIEGALADLTEQLGETDTATVDSP